MTHKIFHIQADNSLVELNEQPYDAESLLQELLANYPNLLGGGEGTRRWLLIKREMGIPFDINGGNRWSLDHLFIDQEAIPTLVEVKRYSDTRIRREVVGQMFDYAANAVLHWPVEKLEAEFRLTVEGQGKNPDIILQEFLESEVEPEEFWDKVKTNLQANKIRLIFVADEIPDELRRIVEFLNQQMDPTEVLALEVKQFVSGNTRSLVPEIIGKTSASEIRKPNSRRQSWDEISFFEVLKNYPDEREFLVARRIYDWAILNGFRIDWGQGRKTGSFFIMLDLEQKYGCYTIVVRHGFAPGTGFIRFQFAKMTQPPFDQIESRRKYVEQFNQLTKINLPDDNLVGLPSVKLVELSDKKKVDGFLESLNWMAEEYKKAV